MSQGFSVISVGNIEFISPYEIKDLVDLRIEKKINDHVRLYIKGIIPEEKKDSYVEKATSKDIIEVKQTDENSSVKSLFKGVITNIEIKAVRGIFYMELEGVSCTYNMDIKLRKRSFQNKDMLYTALAKKVIEDYSGADFIDIAAKSKKIEKFIIQYNESDWEFLIRMASHFNTGLVPDCTSDKPKFWFGIPEGASKGDFKEANYISSRRIEDFRVSSENYISGIDAKDYTYYEIETDMFLDIGDKVSINNISFTVCECIFDIHKCVLRHYYKVSLEKGLGKNLITNKKVFRASVEGKVIDVEKDNVRIHLEIDKEQKKEEAFWFPYTTFYTAEGSTGWYCMPELDDYVKLYFPTDREEAAVVMNSIRKRTKGGDKIDKPDVKYFRTKHKKEQMFNEKELVMSAEDGKVLIKLNEDKGIEFYSDKEIKIKADKDIIMDAENIDLKAADRIDMVCNASSIKMDGTTHISGTIVKVR